MFSSVSIEWPFVGNLELRVSGTLQGEAPEKCRIGSSLPHEEYSPFWKHNKGGLNLHSSKHLFA